MGRKLTLGILALGALVLVGVVFYFLGDSHATRSMNVQRLVPDQLSVALRADRFGDYRHSTLLVSGQVASVAKGDGAPRFTFLSSTDYSVSCRLATDATVPKVGDRVTIAAEGGTAQREPHGVLLVGCMTP